jgi:hypothetical protein
MVTIKNSNRIKHSTNLNYFKDFKAELFAFIVHETQSTRNYLEWYGLHVWSSVCNNVDTETEFYLRTEMNDPKAY